MEAEPGWRFNKRKTIVEYYLTGQGGNLRVFVTDHDHYVRGDGLLAADNKIERKGGVHWFNNAVAAIDFILGSIREVETNGNTVRSSGDPGSS